MRRGMRNLRCGMLELQQTAPASPRITVTSNRIVNECELPAAVLTVIGVLYASQMVRSSVRARVSFHHLDMLWLLVGCFA